MVFAARSAKTIFTIGEEEANGTVLNMISDIGFPILVSFYLLHRVEVKLDAIHAALVSLK